MVGATLPQGGRTLEAGAIPPQAGETMVGAIGATPPPTGGIRTAGLTAAAANNPIDVLHRKRSLRWSTPNKENCYEQTKKCLFGCGLCV